MRGLIQRVARASVEVDGEVVGAIDQGILLLLGVERGDDAGTVQRLLDKVLSYRIFPDPDGKMNLSLRDVRGGLLIVSQFTLAADTQKGLRPSFSRAAEPQLGRQLYDLFLTRARESHPVVQAGRFGADMQVSLVNEGPVTFVLDVSGGPGAGGNSA